MRRIRVPFGISSRVDGVRIGPGRRCAMMPTTDDDDDNDDNDVVTDDDDDVTPALGVTYNRKTYMFLSVNFAGKPLH